MSKYKLSPSQRAFFKTVSQAAFCNPFGNTRLELDLKIADSSQSEDRQLLTRKVIAKVSQELQKLDRSGKSKHTDFDGNDAETMRISFLFEIFHQFMGGFDEHIRKQMEGGDKPLNLPFATQIMNAFYKRGFSELEACRYMAFFFQLRRAFFFLHRDLVGNSPSMKELRCRLWNNLFTHDTKWFGDHLWDRMEDFSTLLLGETGTGKGAAAAAIGRSGHIPFDEKIGRFSESFSKNFIATNLSQFPESLIESELFGHKRGSFTGAINDYKGIFSQCTQHGAIFLDEIGDVTPPVQIKLLHVLQNRFFSPVGSHEKLRFSGRIIAATNRPLNKLRTEGKFRDDFYYRLSSDVITVPSLKERVQQDPEEIRVLLHSVIDRIVSHNTPALVDEMAEILNKNLGKDYSWPGNVRELEQAVRRIFLSGEYAGEIADAETEIGDSIHSRISRGDLSAQEVLFDYCRMLYKRHGTYEKVSGITGLDRRTVKKYILSSES